ncbi:MAG: 3'-5' exonuclease, partial [Gammaproteobacteria bacterium]
VMGMNTLVFDIETIPDTEFGASYFELDGLNPEDTAKAMAHLRQQESGTDFQKLPFHRVVAISAVWRGRGDEIKVLSFGTPESDEAELIRQFFGAIDKYSPTLVSWNGSGFDLPVLHYRAMKHGIEAARYWETGANDQSFRWNNYISRYHERHTDLMDLLALYNLRAAARLDEVASLLGFPGKLGMDGSKVWDAWLAGEIVGIRDYCETDVLNTWLVYLAFERFRGNLQASELENEHQILRDLLRNSGKPHLQEFLVAWPA